MTLLLPAPRTVAFHVARELVGRVRALLVALLTRPRSGPRHRMLSARQIRWQRWKTALVHRLDPVVRTEVAAHSPAPTLGHDVPARTPVWSALHPPPRTAQSPNVAQHDDDEWTDHLVPMNAYALPNPEPGSDWGVGSAAAAHVLSPVEAVGWPETSPETWGETWVEPWSAQPDTGFTGHLDDPALPEPALTHLFVTEPLTTFSTFDFTSADFTTDDSSCVDWPSTGRHALVRTADEHPTADFSADFSGVDLASVFAQSTDETGTVDPAAAEPEQEWEFQVGDLARWWDEAAARLDAAARDEVRNRLW
ncbi:hypothetical protein LZG04_13090 [Saccharothrix sp. S26]|uniref:hypothetical protein n=1 Tax=Saccharothrix sp. S26 TaxID=2907215 RepID=UPI001F198B4E|nr:hypothetical protein [Saccharothrix sp. S26]MCE6995730.1 hypothetical protein [Saccharothrix sp. S26]